MTDRQQDEVVQFGDGRPEKLTTLTFMFGIIGLVIAAVYLMLIWIDRARTLAHNR